MKVLLIPDLQCSENIMRLGHLQLPTAAFFSFVGVAGFLPRIRFYVSIE